MQTTIWPLIWVVQFYRTVEWDCFLRTQYLFLQIVPFCSSNVKQNMLEGQNLKESRKSTNVLRCRFHAWACLGCNHMAFPATRVVPHKQACSWVKVFIVCWSYLRQFIHNESTNIEYSHGVPTSTVITIILWELTLKSEYEFFQSVKTSRFSRMPKLENFLNHKAKL